MRPAPSSSRPATKIATMVARVKSIMSAAKTRPRSASSQRRFRSAVERAAVEQADAAGGGVAQRVHALAEDAGEHQRGASGEAPEQLGEDLLPQAGRAGDVADPASRAKARQVGAFMAPPCWPDAGIGSRRRCARSFRGAAACERGPSLARCGRSATGHTRSELGPAANRDDLVIPTAVAPGADRRTPFSLPLRRNSGSTGGVVGVGGFRGALCLSCGSPKPHARLRDVWQSPNGRRSGGAPQEGHSGGLEPPPPAASLSLFCAFPVPPTLDGSPYSRATAGSAIRFAFRSSSVSSTLT